MPGLAAALILALPAVADTRGPDGPRKRDRAVVAGSLVHSQRLVARLAGWPDPQAAQRFGALLEETGVEVLWKSRLVEGLVVLGLPDNGHPVASGEIWAETPLGGGSLERGAVVEEWRRRLLDTSLFSYVETDGWIRVQLTPDDDGFEQDLLWGLRNQLVEGADVNAESAWDLTTGSPEVVVGILDTGILYTHNELVGQIWVNPAEIPDDGIDNDDNGYVDDIHGVNIPLNNGDPLDDHGHGTHVAGIVGAAANGGGPMVGVAWQVQMMGLKVLTSQGFGSSSGILAGYEYGVENGCRIINASLGGPVRSQAMFDAIAASLRRGVLLVAAAGNDATNNDVYPSYPNGYDLPNVISVAAMNIFGELAGFSNYGANTVHVAAPGEDIYSLGIEGDDAYQVNSGTSMAAPFVSGVATLIASAFPASTPTEIRERIISTAVRSPAFSGLAVSRGWVDAFAALDLEGDGILESTVDPPSGSLILAGRELDITVRVSDLFGITDADVAGTFPALGTVAFANDGVDPDVLADDALYTLRIGIPDQEGPYSFSVRSTAEDKEESILRVSYQVVHPPANDNFAHASKLPSGGTGSSFLETTSLFTTIECLEPGGAICDCNAEEPEPPEDEDGEEAPEPVPCNRIEPYHAEQPLSDHSLWWSWTASEDAEVLVSTLGSDFDTVLAIYTGSELGSLEEVASSDNVGTSSQSYLTFPADEGVSYRIAVAGVETGDFGTVRLQLYPGGMLDEIPPQVAVDEPASGLVQHENRVSLRGTSRDPGPNATGVESVQLRINDGVIATYADGTEEWTASIFLLAGENRISVLAHDYVGNVSPSETVVVNYIPKAPPHDHFYSARRLEGVEGELRDNNSTATRQEGEPFHSETRGGHSLWYAYTPETDGLLDLEVTYADFDPVLALYTGDRVGDLELVANNDDRNEESRLSALSEPVRGGVAYHLALDGYSGASGSLRMSWNLETGTVYRLGLQSDPGGRVSREPGLVLGGRAILLRALPEPGYVFAGWEGTLEALDNPLPVRPDSDLALRARFVPDLDDDFEGEPASGLDYSSEGAPWERGAAVDGPALLGGGSARSGAVSDLESSVMRLRTQTPGGPGRFHYRVSSEEGWDHFEFRLNGALLLRESGDVSWRDFQFEMPEGENVLEWTYAKDNAQSWGEDAAYVDNLFLPRGDMAGPELPLSISGEPNRVYTIEASTDLQEWQAWQVEEAGSDGLIRFRVPEYLEEGLRFYRAVLW